MAYRIIGHAEDAEDLAQEALLRVLSHLPSFRGKCRFSAWVYRVALNACLTSRKRKRPLRLALNLLAIIGINGGSWSEGDWTDLLRRGFQLWAILEGL
jgi:DNA-directed RNA polymerase specialized sigma24 family protein